MRSANPVSGRFDSGFSASASIETKSGYQLYIFPYTMHTVPSISVISFTQFHRDFFSSLSSRVYAQPTFAFLYGSGCWSGDRFPTVLFLYYSWVSLLILTYFYFAQPVFRNRSMRYCNTYRPERGSHLFVHCLFRRAATTQYWYLTSAFLSALSIRCVRICGDKISK